MRWQAAVVDALASAFITTAAFAEVHILDNPAGEVSAYVQKFHELREAGELSATLQRLSARAAGELVRLAVWPTNFSIEATGGRCR